jgi:predicted esterase
MQIQNIFTHKFIPNTNSKDVVLLLHGTGGDENDLIPLSQIILPDASILSLRGNVQEMGMNRFFRRFPDGSFDIRNIKEEVEKLKEFLDLASKEYDFRIKDLIIYGYSNGANFGLSFMLLNPKIIQRAVLLHPMLTIAPKDLELGSSKFIITNGKYDTFTTPEQRASLVKLLNDYNAEVYNYEHEYGHEIRPDELEFIKSKITLLV